MPGKSFCGECHEPVIHDGYDWYHERTGHYGAYANDDNKHGAFLHFAIPGGRKPEKRIREQ
jgi:hypothetical protein